MYWPRHWPLRRSHWWSSVEQCSKTVVRPASFTERYIISDEDYELDLATHIRSMPSVGPATVLERSQKYLPETYTLEYQIPNSCMMILQSYEERSTVGLRTNVYRSIYYKSPRQWQWLTIYLEVRRCSKYWTATRISPTARKSSRSVAAPNIYTIKILSDYELRALTNLAPRLRAGGLI